MTVEIRLLGSIELRRGARKIDLGTPRQRCVLASLALNVGQPVPTDVLVDRVWGEELPRNVRNSLYSHISRLRSALGEATGADGRSRLRRAGGGYLLDVEPDAVDLHRARRLVAGVRAALAQGDLEGAAGALGEASTLLAGAPLAGLKGHWAELVRANIVQERLAVLVERFDLELRLGRHAAAIAPLQSLLVDHPLAEPVAGLLILALHRAGRPADALEVYTRIRKRMVEEIGDEPGPSLQLLHEKVLRRDPELLAVDDTDDEASAPPPAPEPVVGQAVAPIAQLPPDTPTFTGREQQLRVLDGALAALEEDGHAGGTLLIEGIAGVGKTALAVHWAHRVKDRFSDGQLYVDLCGFAIEPPLSPVQALGRFLRALGVPATSVPAEVEEATALYRSLLAHRRVLIILDNAVDSDQVRCLLPTGAGSMALVTSRHQLTGLVAREGAVRLPLGVMEPEDSLALLTEVLGADRVRDEDADVVQLADLCNHLPLALRIAAAHITGGPPRPVAYHLARMRDRDPLAALAVRGDDRSAVAAAFDLSYARLPVAARRTLRLLGLLPGRDFTVEVAAALTGTTAEEAEATVQELVALHMVNEPVAYRFTMHDLVRAYAADRAGREDSEAARRAAVARVHEHYLGVSVAATQLLNPSAVRLPLPPAAAEAPAAVRFDSETEALAWLDAECANLVSHVTNAAATGELSVAWRLADTLRSYLGQRAHPAEGTSSRRPAWPRRRRPGTSTGRRPRY